MSGQKKIVCEKRPKIKPFHWALGVCCFLFIFSSLYLHAFASELEDRFLQMRQEEIESKQRKIEDLSYRIEAMQEQLSQERESVRASQERIWQEFSRSIEVERKELESQMETLQERQRLFETELDKKGRQDEIRLQERETEIKRLISDFERLRAEMVVDKKDLGVRIKDLEEKKKLRGERLQVVPESQRDVIEGATIRVIGARGREIMGEEPLRTRHLRPEYYIEIGDVLDIDVWRVPDLSRAISVRPDGRISLPLAGDLDVLGLTLVELRDLMTKKLSSFIRNPQISISIRQFGGRKFIMLGEVRSPGVYRFQEEVTLLEGIALAGGFNKGARRGKIMIVRGDIRKEPQVRIISANLESVLKRGVISENLRVLPNDIIYVGRDFVGDYRDVIDNLIQPALDGVIDFFVLRSAVREAQQRSA